MQEIGNVHKYYTAADRRTPADRRTVVLGKLDETRHERSRRTQVAHSCIDRHISADRRLHVIDGPESLTTGADVLSCTQVPQRNRIRLGPYTSTNPQ
jgi:hypothetical protein